MLISGMLEIRAGVLDYEGLARASPTPQERLSRSRPRKNSFSQSDEGVRDAVPQRSDRGDE